MAAMPSMMWFAGSWASQMVEQRKTVKETYKTGGFLRAICPDVGYKLNKERVLFDTAWGGIFGYQLGTYTLFMTRMMPGMVLKRTLTSWVIISPILNGEYVIVRGAIKSMEEEKARIKKDGFFKTVWYDTKESVLQKLPNALVKSAIVWPISFWAAYAVVPLKYNVFFMNSVAVLWSAIMSNLGARKMKMQLAAEAPSVIVEELEPEEEK
jgi:hypothetical protein